MDRLSEICTPSKRLFIPQLMFFKKEIESSGGSLELVHQFLVKIKIQKIDFHLKVNLIDNEFYLFSEQHPILFFRSFRQLKKWFYEQNFLNSS